VVATKRQHQQAQFFTAVSAELRALAQAMTRDMQWLVQPGGPVANGTHLTLDHTDIIQRWQDRTNRLTALAEVVAGSPLLTATGPTEPQLTTHMPMTVQLRDRTVWMPSIKTLSPITATIIALSADTVTLTVRQADLPDDFSGETYRLLAEFSFGRITEIDAELTIVQARTQFPHLLRITASFLRLAPEVRLAIRRQARRQTSKAR
jgi:hypothetical protein